MYVQFDGSFFLAGMATATVNPSRGIARSEVGTMTLISDNDVVFHDAVGVSIPFSAVSSLRSPMCE